MRKEKTYCRACHQLITSRQKSIFQHHKSCAKELLEAFYEWSEKNSVDIEEYVAMRSLLAFCLTWMNHFRNMIQKIPDDILLSSLNDIERMFLKRNPADDYSVLWTEVNRSYPNLANALSDLTDVITSSL